MRTLCGTILAAAIAAAIAANAAGPVPKWISGDAVAQYVLKLLSGRKAAPPKVVRRFIPGKSL